MERLTMGQYFRSERERLGISLKDIEHRTKIPYQTLVWLEEDNIEVLPPRAFLRGFLQVISKEFGMDEPELFRLMDVGLYKLEKSRNIPLERETPKSGRKIILYIIACIIIFAVIIMILIYSFRYWEISSYEPDSKCHTASMIVIHNNVS